MTLLLNRYVIGAALAAFFFAGAYLKGRADCSAKYEYAALKQERDELRILQQVTNAARDADAKHIQDNEALLRDIEQKAEDDAAKMVDPDRICFEPDDGVRNLFRLSR